MFSIVQVVRCSLAVFVAWLPLIGCERPAADVAPYRPIGPPPAEQLYVCDWTPHPPPERRVLVDVMLWRTDPPTRPTSAEVDSLRRFGATVRHLFWLPVVRVEIDRDRILALVESRLASSVRTVRNPDRRDLGIIIFFARPARGSDADRIEELGGYVRWRPDPVHDGRPMLEASVPDAAIPPILAISGVTQVRANSSRCATFW